MRWSTDPFPFQRPLPTSDQSLRYDLHREAIRLFTEEVARRGSRLMTKDLGATDAVSLVCGDMVLFHYDLVRTENGITLITRPIGVAGQVGLTTGDKR